MKRAWLDTHIKALDPIVGTVLLLVIAGASVLVPLLEEAEPLFAAAVGAVLASPVGYMKTVAVESIEQEFTRAREPDHDNDGDVA